MTLAFLVLAACGGPTPHVARGEPYSTGNPTFDDFFNAVKEVRGEVLAAPDDAEVARAGLARALGLDPKAPAAQEIEEAGSRAKKLQEKGVLLHLEIAPEPKLLTAKGKADLGSDGALIEAVESSVKRELEMKKRLVAAAARAAELEKRRADLRSQAPDAFQKEPQSKRDEVLAELDAAKGVLADAGDGAGKAAGAASRFVVELVQAVETGGASLMEPVKPGKGKKGWAAGPRTGGAPAPKAGTASAPAAPPAKKKPKGGDDFEP